jgi:WD40 repeat protein
MTVVKEPSILVAPSGSNTGSTHRLDAKNPWPGLESFQERDALFFRGRRAETEELLGRVRRTRLTIVYGRSGLGKSSLLQAGIFPTLRQELFLPVYVRLRYNPDAPPLREQVLAELDRAVKAAEVEAPATDPRRTLWEHFHRRDEEFWSDDNQMVTPVLVFDQFEEAFTIGQAPERAPSTASFLEELGDLIEGRPPVAVRERVDAGDQDARGFAATRHDYKVLLGIRVDFLAQLEKWRARVPMLGSNRMELGPFRGDAALLVTDAGSDLIADGVAEKIVRLVGDAEDDEPIHQIVVDPALLSLFCSQLNERRKAASQSQITADLVAGNREAILDEFYARSVGDLPPSVHEFIEDRLLTVDGYRNSEALQNAKVRMSEDDIQRLVDRRLIRVEESQGRPARLELTHDVLVEPVKKSRQIRLDQEKVAQAEAALTRARRNFMVRAAVFLAALVPIAVMALLAQRWTQRSALLGEFRAAAQVADPMEQLALLASSIGHDPNFSPARALALSILESRSWPVLRIGQPGIVSAAFSPDGGRVVTASLDFTAQVWDSHNGMAHGPPMRHSYRLWTANFSHDGRWVVTASRDSTAQVWDAEDGRRIGAALRHAGEVNYAEFSPDGKQVVTASDDRTARIWDSRTGQPIGAPLVHEGLVIGASFSPDGRLLVTSSTDGVVRIWDVATRDTLRVIRVDGNVRLASFGPDGKKVVTVSGSSAQIWNVETAVIKVGERMHHVEDILCAAFSPDGRFLVTGSDDKTAQVWDVSTGDKVGPALHHEGKVWTARFSPDGERIATAAGDSPVQIWDRRSWTFRAARRRRMPLRHTDQILFAEFSPDGKRVVTASADSTVQVWSVDMMNGPWRTGPSNGGLMDASFSPDGRMILTASADSTARVWDARSGDQVIAVRHAGAVIDARFSPDGQRFVSASDDSTAQVWDARTGARIGAPMRHRGRVIAAAFSPNGLEVVTASLDKTAQIWDARTGARVGRPLEHSESVYSAAFSPDGREVVTGSEDSTAQIWSVDDQRRIGSPYRHESWVATAVFSLDGNRVLTASGNVTQAWDVRSGARVGPPLIQGNVVYTAAYTHDGNRIVTASRGGAVQIWDSRTGARLGPLLPNDGTASSAAFSPDGRRVIASSSDSTAHVWDVDSIVGSWLVLRHTGIVRTARFSPSGRELVTASEDGTAQRWDSRTGAKLGPAMKHEGWVMSAAFSPDEQSIVTASLDRTAQIWDRSGRKVGKTLRLDLPVRDAVFSPDGSVIVTSTNGGTAQFWSASTQEPLPIVLRHGAGIVRVTFSRDGRRVVTASDDRTAQVWDARTGTRLGPRMLHDDAVLAADFSGDGQRVVTGSWDHTAQVWDPVSGVKLGSPFQHTANIRSAVFSPDGQQVLTGCEDDAARLWDAPTGSSEEAKSMRDFLEAVARLRIGRDGSEIPLGQSEVDARMHLVLEALDREKNPKRGSFAEFLIGYLGRDERPAKRAR